MAEAAMSTLSERRGGRDRKARRADTNSAAQWRQVHQPKPPALASEGKGTAEAAPDGPDEQIEQRIAAAFRLIATLVADPALIETLPDDVPTVEFVGIGPGYVVECAHLGSACVELDGRRHA